MEAARKSPHVQIFDTYFQIRITSITPDIPIPYDLYLYVNDSAILFRRQGDLLSSDRIGRLLQKGGEMFLVPKEHRQIYLDSLYNIVRDPSSSMEDKGKFLKESAYVHVNDLFTKKDVASVVTDAGALIDEMVKFVTTDLDAVTRLMGLSRHDYYTYNHCVDVAVYSIVLARRILGEDKEMLIRAGLGGLLHDIGKRDVRWELINKNSPLTPGEWDEIRAHPEHGKKLLTGVPGIPDESKCVVHQHHENFDGTGYPQKLRADEISPLARVVTIADVFDALTTDRSYHKAISSKEAIATMFGMQPGKFDPTIFKAFNKNFSNKKPSMLLTEDFDPCSAQGIVQAFKKR